MSTTISQEQFGGICDGVWRDRTAILAGRGFLSPEAALIRAVYWRLCKAGVSPIVGDEKHTLGQTIATYHLVVKSVLELSARPPFDGGPLLEELGKRYQNEVGQAC